MKRRIITIVATLAVIVATLCLGLTMTACTEKKADSYKISVVYADGTPVNGLTDGIGGADDEGNALTKVLVQICAVNPDTHATGFCNAQIDLGADGKVEVKKGGLNEAKRKSDEKWHVQLNGLKDGYTYDDIYLDSYGSYTITVTAQN